MILRISSTAPFQVGHRMVASPLSSADEVKKNLRVLPSHEMYFKKAQNYKEGVAAFLRGVGHTTSQELDLKIRNSVCKFLFAGASAEKIAFDLVSLNQRRGRNSALPTFSDVR